MNSNHVLPFHNYCAIHIKHGEPDWVASLQTHAHTDHVKNLLKLYSQIINTQ